MNTEEIQEQWKNGGRIYGCAVVSSSPHWPLMLKNSGIDFVFLDTEHISLGRETLANMCQIYRALEIAPIVRIPSPDPYQACMVLDGGATGVVAPYVESVEEVKALVGAVKFRPLKGKKLKDVLAGKVTLPDKLNHYIKGRTKSNLLFINIESREAVDQLDALIAVEGLDGIIIGPHDLSCSLEIPEDYNHPIFVEAVETIIRKASAELKAVAIHFPGEPSHQIKYAKSGTNMILHSADIFMFQRVLASEMNQIKTAMGERLINDEINLPVV